MLDQWISDEQVAGLFDPPISRRYARRLAAKFKWPTRLDPVRGGRRKLYLTSAVITSFSQNHETAARRLPLRLRAGFGLEVPGSSIGGGQIHSPLADRGAWVHLLTSQQSAVGSHSGQQSAVGSRQSGGEEQTPTNETLSEGSTNSGGVLPQTSPAVHEPMVTCSQLHSLSFSVSSLQSAVGSQEAELSLRVQMDSDLSFADHPDAARRIAAKRLKAIEQWEVYARTEGPPGQARRLAEVADEFARIWNATRTEHGGVEVSRTTLYRWRAAFRRHGITGLVDRRAISSVGVATRKEIPAQFWGGFLGLWARQSRLSVTEARRVALGSCPESDRDEWAREYSVSLFQARVAELPEQFKVLAREGEKAWQDKCQQPVRRDYTSLDSNQLWCSDHHQLDLWVWDPIQGKPIRPWYSVWTDVRSRMVLSYSLELTSANQERVLCTWADGVLDWGLPSAVYIDNGKDYRSQAFSGGRPTTKKMRLDEEEVTSILSELEVGCHFALPYNARSKPVERSFRDLTEQFEKHWPSYCGNKPDESRRPEQVKKMLKDSPEQCPRIEAVRAAMATHVQWFNSEWRSSGDGMNRRTPIEVYEAHLHNVRFRPSIEQLKLCLMPSQKLTVRRGCVQLDIPGVGGRWYADQSGQLTNMGGQEVKARFNPRDLTTIFLFHANGQYLFRAIEQSRVGWFDQETGRAAIRRRKKQDKAVHEGLKATRQLYAEPADPIEALKARNRGYAAEQEKKTGTDDRSPITDQPITSPEPRPRLRIRDDGPDNTDKGITPIDGSEDCRARSGESGHPDAGPSSPCDTKSWMDEILGEAGEKKAGEQGSSGAWEQEDDGSDWQDGL